jgi:hypothetical protein
MPYASFGSNGTFFLDINVFIVYFLIFIYYYDTQQPWNAGQRPPHPPRLQMRAGDGHSYSSDAKHPTPPSSLANTSRGWVFPSSTIRPTKAGRPQQQTKANAGSQQPTKANAGSQQPTQANTGSQQPTKANAGSQQPTQAPSSQRRPTQAHSSQRRPTQAHDLGIHLASTTTNESSRLVGGSLGIHLASTTPTSHRNSLVASLVIS